MIDRAAKINPLADQKEKAGQQSLDKKALKKACAQFEGLIMHQLLKGMRRTVSESNLLHGGPGEKIWKDMFDQVLAEEAGQSGSLGLGDLLYRQLLGQPQVGPDQTGLANQNIEAYLKSANVGRQARDSQLDLPVEGRITSNFGLREHPILGGLRMHHGLDLAAPSGTSIRAAQGGKVTFSGQSGNYGYLVEIDHGNGLTTRYAHNQENLVEAGQEVKAGQVVAKVGSSGLSTGPHLHFEVRQNGQPVDPLSLLEPTSLRRAKAEPAGQKDGQNKG